MAGWAPVANLITRRSDGATGGKLLATAGSKKTRQRLLEEGDDMICKSPSGCKNKNWLLMVQKGKDVRMYGCGTHRIARHRRRLFLIASRTRAQLWMMCHRAAFR